MRYLSVFIAAAVSCFAQGSGSISGSVSSSSGVSLGGVKITVSDPAGKAVTTSVSDVSGVFRVGDLAPGPYVVLFEAAGLHPHRVQVDVSAGGTEMPAVTLSTGDRASESHIVRAPVVDPERVQQADTILFRQIRQLPINRRNYLNLASLTPGVVETGDNVAITDATLPQAPQSGLSFGGNNGRGNIFWLDGGENYVNTGGVRPSISQEAVAEFRVDRSNYSAEFGGGIGGIVNIVSQSGGPAFHGNVFGFLRHRSVQARNYFDPGKGAFTRTQVGGTLGGPIRKDRTFFFAAFERLQRQESTFVPILRDRSIFSRLTPSQTELLDFLGASGSPVLQALAALSRQALVSTSYPSTIALFDANSGVFPFGEKNTLGSLRVDHRFSDNHNVFLRFNAGNGDSQNAQVEGLTGFNRGLVSDSSDRTLMLNDTFVISDRWVSESRISFNRFHFDASNRDKLGPSLEINGFGYFGKEYTLPSALRETHLQFQQNFFYSTGRHSLRFGADINPVGDDARVETNLGGRFIFGEYLPLGALYNQFTGNPNAADQLAATLTALGGARLVPNINAPITALQAFNLGVPSVYVQGFGDPTWSGWFKRYNFFVNDVIRLSPSLVLNAGLRYELEVNPDPLPTDPNNFSPRIGLAWNPGADRRTVVRAGYGLFYSRNHVQTAAAIHIQSGATYNQIVVPLTGLPGSMNPATGMLLTSADVYRALSAQGIIGRRAIVAGDLAQFGIVPGPNFPYQVTFLPPQDFVSAYSQQASFEVERAVGSFALSAAYNFNRAAHVPRIRDTNVQYGPPGPNGLPVLAPRNPLASQTILVESAANSFYHAFILQATRRFERGLTLNAHYTFSKSIDEATDLNFLPNDSLNARADRGLSTFDQRHRFVASAIIDLPGTGRTADGALNAWLGGFVLSPLVVANSGRPFNVVTGQDPFTRPAYAGRNIGQGPRYVNVDLRLSRHIRLGDSETRSLELIAEGFNMFNHTNFRRVNNVVGQVTVDQLPQPIVGVRGNPTDPLAFLSTFDPRQFQFALKFHF